MSPKLSIESSGGSIRTNRKIEIDRKTGLELLLGTADLSQRGCNNQRQILAKSKIKMSFYKDIMKYEETIEVGIIEAFHGDDYTGYCICQGYKTDFKETLQMTV